MAREKQVQINIIIPKTWRDELKRLARQKSAHTDRDISMSALIREAIRIVYSFPAK